ncbi:hypothetical protein ACQ4LE_011120 [Meloidogyne hapla]
MASKFPKIASSKIRNQDSTPFFASLRDFLLGVKRQPITPPPGLPTEDGEAHYQPHNRFPNTQSARSIEPASTEEGIVRKIADNYYYSRDARRDVLPPPSVYDIGPHETACYAVTDGSVSFVLFLHNNFTIPFLVPKVKMLVRNKIMVLIRRFQLLVLVMNGQEVLKLKDLLNKKIQIWLELKNLINI